MPLYDPKCRPWWRKVDFTEVRHETSTLCDEHELLYYRFLLAYTEHRCRLSADPVVLARVLHTSKARAASFLRACADFISVDDSNLLVHESSLRDFEESVEQSVKQSKRQKARWDSVRGGKDEK